MANKPISMTLLKRLIDTFKTSYPVKRMLQKTSYIPNDISHFLSLRFRNQYLIL